MNVFKCNSFIYRCQDVTKVTDSEDSRSAVIYRPQPRAQPSIAHQQQYTTQNFNWSPQYILNQNNHNRVNPQQQNELSEFCSTNAPYLSMRQSNSQRHGVSSQNALNYSRYSGGSMYGAIQPRYVGI